MMMCIGIIFSVLGEENDADSENAITAAECVQNASALEWEVSSRNVCVVKTKNEQLEMSVTTACLTMVFLLVLAGGLVASTCVSVSIIMEKANLKQR